MSAKADLSELKGGNMKKKETSKSSSMPATRDSAKGSMYSEILQDNEIVQDLYDIVGEEGFDVDECKCILEALYAEKNF